MRIPTNSFSQTVVSQLQKLTAQQTQLESEVTTGLRYTNPSDDPASMARLLNLEAEQRQIQQFQRNNDRATAISQTTYSAVSQLKSISDRAGELGVLGKGGKGADGKNAK